MGGNGVDHPLKHLEEKGGSSQGYSKDFLLSCRIYDSVEMDNKYSNERLVACSFQHERNQKTNSSRPSSVLEIFQAKEFNVGSSPRRG
ncbi:hypothetical protein TB2_021571 [Malus domestica]